MKKKLGEIFYSLLSVVINIRLTFYRTINISKPAILVFTDSRGYDVTRPTYKYSPFSWYTKYFVKNYKSDTFVCPEKITTVYDFLEAYDNSHKNYKFVIAHIGVVDFAARPLSQNIAILKSKKHKIIKFFGEDIYHKLLNFKGYETRYNGEITSSTVPEFMVEFVAKEFNKIDNLIWISCNDLDLSWQGNYFKERPANSVIIKEKSNEMLRLLTTKTVLNITKWSYDEVKKYTCDNVHLTKKGSSFILENLLEIIKNNYS